MIWICLVAVALVVLTAWSEPSWMNVLSNERNELVFEHRMRDYGAYQLRKNHAKHLATAFTIATGLLCVLGFATGSGQDMRVNTEEVMADLNARTMAQLEEIFEIPEKKQANKVGEKAPPSAPPKQPAASESTPIVTDDPITSTFAAVSEPTELELPAMTGDPFATPTATTPGGSSNDDVGGGAGTGKSTEDRIEDVATEMPSFPGGDVALTRYLQSKIWLSESDIERNVSGTLWFTFVVRKNGKVDNIELLRGWGETTDVERRAKNALTSMPEWKPGTMNGVPVNVRVRVPVKIILRN
jgi:periplasmic protein TonB